MKESGGTDLSARELRVETLKSAPPFRVWDVLLYAVLAALIGALLWAVFARRTKLDASAEFEVYVDNRLTMTVSAATDGEYEVKRGETVLLVLVVDRGVATVRGSVCDDKLCERMKIASTGQQIVCLPNGVSVQVKTTGIGGPVVPVG